MLIKGTNLTPKQTDQVKAAFVHRWTSDNAARNAVWERWDKKPTKPLETDEEWIKSRAFHFIKDGSRLMLNRSHAEPVYMVD